MARRTLVLDTSAVIAGFVPGLANAEQITVSEVLEEARDLCSKLELETAVLAGKVKVAEPSENSLAEVRAKVKDTGDTVSRTDIKLLALALDLRGKGAELVTDDYAIQNLASLLDIPYLRVAMPGIKEVLRWEAVCPACGRRYPPLTTKCLTCGSKLGRRPRR
ncbi:MAG: hypothetical protein QMD95_00610 [Candidatus Hodarchaeaceae archaeon]|nr:hypothetical protein [Candidatus Hodarchaeaceae archaeon]